MEQQRISPVEPWVAQRTGLGAELTPQTLLAWQLERISELALELKESLPFYGERYGDWSGRPFATAQDFARLPFTTAADILADPWGLCLLPAKEVERIVTLPTSGSSGAKKRIFFTEKDLEQTVDFFAVGMTTMAEAGDRVLILMPSRAPGSVGDVLSRGLARYGAQSILHGPLGEIQAGIRAAESAQCIVAPPGDAVRLARYAPHLRPKSVLLSADYAAQSLIDALQQRWECPVYTHYGMTETAFGCAVQCKEQQGHHLRSADIYVEIVDPNTGELLPPGRVGEIVLTTFTRQAMPLVRYRTGDLGSISPQSCACGGVLPQLGRVLGRKDGIRTLKNGTPLSMPLLQELLYAQPGAPLFDARYGDDGLELDLYGGTEEECSRTQKLVHIVMDIPVTVRSVPERTMAPTGMEKSRMG